MGSMLPDHKIILDFFGPTGWRLAHSRPQSALARHPAQATGGGGDHP
jgi:hypothetical protein